MDMKFAVQTCVLSKRWKNIWMSLPFIKSRCTSFREGRVINLSETVNRFQNFVDKVFELRDQSDIQMVRLGFAILNDTSVETLNRWILAAVNHSVQILSMCVNYYFKSGYEIPHQLLNSKSLKSLGLMAVGKCIYIILPKSMILPQIKMLGLVGIAIPNLEFQRLFSSCPLLESVVIKKCDVQTNNQSNIVIDSRSLKLLVLVDNRHTHIGPADHSLSYTTKIYAPNAKDFTCTGFMREDFSLENLSSLVSASFEMSSGEEDETAETYSELPKEEKEVFAKRMLKLLGGVQNVRHLSLSSGVP